jgi:glycosyltransferase involved in cell wall biosynthesis
VTVRDRAELLGERCLPSILGQSYGRLEVLVVGDDAPDAVRAVAEGTGDPRVRFVNVTTRVVKDDPLRQWLTAATMPRNEAYRLARGRWTLDFDDDDALVPDAVERLVEHARATRAEVPYGIARQHQPDGTTIPIGDDPPALHRFSLAAALVHGHLRFFAREHVASSLRLPGDWYRAERMLRAGVRFSRLERVVFDYHPSSYRPA